MKKTLILFAVIMITLTAYAQKSKIVKIRIHTIIKVDEMNRQSVSNHEGLMGLDVENEVVYTYYSDGTYDAFPYVVDRRYQEGNYDHIGGLAVNPNNNRRLYLNIGLHKYENTIIITFADDDLGMSFLGKIL